MTDQNYLNLTLGVAYVDLVQLKNGASALYFRLGQASGRNSSTHIPAVLYLWFSRTFNKQWTRNNLSLVQVRTLNINADNVALYIWIKLARDRSYTVQTPFFICFGQIHRPGTCKEVVSVHAMKLFKGSRGTAPFFLNVGTGWRWVLNFSPWPLYPLERSHVSTE
jgi:hypothetical protein